MATQQVVMNAGVADATALAGSKDWRQLYLRNYSTSTQTIWIAFGKAATPGNNGELELIPGGEYVFGGPLPPAKQTLPGNFFLPTVPTEDVHVITSSGAAKGCIMVQT